MDEELLKRNTDCVYFLASPFTCKKGAECEYRHSEMARLNPRDCWYWLSGNCLNPTCAFRHPPMDIHTETAAQDEPLPDNSPLPPSKNSVPCYFYFNAYCSKGAKCSFLHGSEDTSAGKPKIDSASTGAPPSDTKIPSKASVPKIPAEPLDANAPLITPDTKIHARLTDNKVCLITEPVPDLPEKGTGLLDVALETGDEVPLHEKKRIQSSDTYSIIERKASHHSLASEFKETTVSKSASLNPPENMVKSDPSIYSDQSSEDQVDKDVRDEWWESSPGFDVLVEGKSEGMDYGDEQEYMHGYNDGYDGNDEDHENPFLDHRYENRNDSSDRFLHENRIHEPPYYSDDDERYDLNGYSHGDRETNHTMHQKRKFVAIELPVRGHYSGDLREHLSKRRFHATRDGFRHSSFPLHTTEERLEEPQQSSIHRLHGRLASKLERNGVSLTAEKSAFVNPNQRGRVRNSQLTTRHNHHERKRLQFSSRVQRRPFSRQKRDIDNNNTSFSAPKTLSQIKEGRDRTSSSEARHSGQNSSVNFEGPKPFSEILKEKKRGSSGQEEDINISS